MKKVTSLQYGVIELEIDQVETEKSFKPTIGKVDTRFDLFAEDRKNRIVVDIQHE